MSDTFLTPRHLLSVSSQEIRCTELSQMLGVARIGGELSERAL